MKRYIISNEKIAKGNELIAKYVGMQQGKPNETRWASDWFDVDGFIDGARHKKLLFHDSWDWLMPVVEKIEMTTVYSITTDYDRRDEFKGWSVHLYTLWPKDEIIGYILDKRFETKREATWYAVVEYIKWYNKQK